MTPLAHRRSRPDWRPAGVALLLIAAAIGPGPARGHGALQAQIDAASAQIARQPGDAKLLLRRAELHRQHEDWDAALADCDRAAALDPTLETLDLVRGRALSEAGRAEQARAPLERFLARHPDHVEARLARARSLGALGEHRGAAADFGRVIERGARLDPEWVVQRALMLERAGDTAAALEALDAGIARLGPVASLQRPAIELETRMRRLEPALARLETLAARSPRKEAWWAERGDLLATFNRHDDARQAYAAALAAIEALPQHLKATPAMKSLETRVRVALARP